MPRQKSQPSKAGGYAHVASPATPEIVKLVFLEGASERIVSIPTLLESLMQLVDILGLKSGEWVIVRGEVSIPPADTD